MENKVTVVLTSRALKDLQKIRTFNDNLIGILKSKEIINNIFDRIQILENPQAIYTEIGAVDEEFEHLKYQYRKLIESHYKITYRVEPTKYMLSEFLIRDKTQTKTGNSN